MDWAKVAARGYKKHFSFGIWCNLYSRLVSHLPFGSQGLSSPSLKWSYPQIHKVSKLQDMSMSCLIVLKFNRHLGSTVAEWDTRRSSKTFLNLFLGGKNLFLPISVKRVFLAFFSLVTPNCGMGSPSTPSTYSASRRVTSFCKILSHIKIFQ